MRAAGYGGHAGKRSSAALAVVECQRIGADQRFIRRRAGIIDDGGIADLHGPAVRPGAGRTTDIGGKGEGQRFRVSEVSEILDVHFTGVADRSAHRIVCGQIDAQGDARGRVGRALAGIDHDRLQAGYAIARLVRHGAVGICRPAQQDEARGRAQDPLIIRAERAGTGHDHVLRPGRHAPDLGNGGDRQHAAARDRDIERTGGGHEIAALLDIAACAGAHAAGRIDPATPRLVDHHAFKLGIHALVAIGAGVRDIVRDIGEARRVRGQSRDAGAEGRGDRHSVVTLCESCL